MSVSVFDNGLLSPLLGDAETAALFGIEAEIAAMLRFEAALAEAEAEAGLIPADSVAAIRAGLEGFAPDLKALAEDVRRDGVVVPGLVRQLRAHIGEPHARHLHFGSTTQDVTDTALVLRLRDVIAIFRRRLDAIDAALAELRERFGANPLMGRTRMQQAVPITVGDRLDAWILGVDEQIDRLPGVSERLLQLQFGGAAGTLEKLQGRGVQVARRLAAILDLACPPRNWHSRRTALAEFAGWLSQVSGTLGKIGQDVALMAQNEVGEVRLAGGGGSSAMPHKQNPVGAEVLVALARFNATLLPAMHHALVHENERSGMAWTLEWMVLPQMCVATGASLDTSERLLANIVSLGRDA